MSNLALIVVIGLAGGMAVALQAPLASAIGQRLGMLESVFIVHLGGLLVVAVPLLLMGGGRLAQWQTVPPLNLAAGVFGVAVVASTVFTVPRIGAAAAIVLIITGQLFIAAMIDHFGLFGVILKPLSLHRFMGLALVLLGAWWALRH